MAKNPINRGRKIATALVLIALVLALVFAARWFFSPGSLDESNRNTGAGSGTSQGTYAPANANGQARQGNKPAQAQEATQAKVSIKGKVKNSNNEVVKGVVVSLYAGNERIGQSNADDGTFNFKAREINPGTTYSLQAKVPGLIGEETFTSNDVAPNSIGFARDITMKPVPSAESVPTQPTPPPQPQVTTMRIDETQAHELAPKINSIHNSLASISSSFTVLLLVLLITLPLLALIIYMLYRGSEEVGLVAQNSLYLQELVKEDARIRVELEKLAGNERLYQILQGIPSSLDEGIQKLIESRRPNPQDGLQESSKQGISDAGAQPYKQSRQSGQGVALAKTLEGSSKQRAIGWYKDLLDNKANTNPIYLQVDMERSKGGIGEQRRVCFTQTLNQSSFVLFSEEGSKEGWIFPNPMTNFAPDHKYVYNDLNAENFARIKSEAPPLLVELQDGYWQLVSS